MSFVQCNLQDLLADMVGDSVDDKIVIGPLAGPIATGWRGHEAEVYAFDYGILSTRHEGFFVGTIEIPTTEEGELPAHSFRNRIVRTLKRNGVHAVDTSTFLQFAHVCEGMWPCEGTKALRREIEQKKSAERNPIPQKLGTYH